MKAIILNSGIGKRMGDLTRQTPKCMVELKPGETILSRQIKTLSDNNIKEIIITTGPFPEKIEQHMESRFKGINFTYVHNPSYETTNYIYSLHLAAEHATDDIILMHGDLVFDDAVMEKLLHSEHENAVLINPTAKLPEKDFKGRIKDNLLKKVSIDIFGEDCHFLIPMYKLTKDTFKKWLAEIEAFIKEGKTAVYAEEALNNILETTPLHPVYFNEEFCTEIDNIEDLKTARKFI